MSGYDPAVTDLWIYTPLEDTWYLIGTDTGSFEVIDSTTIHMTIPASLLASPTTLTVELYNNDTSEYSDKDLPVNAASNSASMILGELQQSGNQVVAPISWSGPVDNPTVECGTTPPQQHSGAVIHCVYSTPGTYSVTGTYGSGQTADPVAVEVPSLALQNGQIAITIQGTPRASFTAYSFPVPVDLVATFITEAGIGIPDSLDLGQTTLSATPDTGPAITAAVSTQNGQTYGGRLHLPAAGNYTLALNGKTLSGQAITTSTTFPVTGGRITLTAGALAQAGPAVTLPVQWPTEASTLTDPVVDCDTSNGQAFMGTAGQCVFTRPGTYTLLGRFTDTLGTLGVHTDPMTITVPAVAGTPIFRAIAANGHVPTHDLSGPIPVATYGAPTVYPVPVQVNLTLGPPAAGQVGIADSLDRSQTTIYVKPVSTAADRTAPATAGDTALSVHDSGDGINFQSSTGLTVFPRKPDDPSRWQYRLIVDGQTETGLPVKTEMDIEGPFGDPNLISYTTWQRVDPIYPYAPATFRYVMTGLKSGITGEPMTQNWSSSEGETKRQTAPDGYFDALFLSSGAKTVTLAGSGPLSGTKPFVDGPVIPPAPPAAIAFTITPPKYNRPPAPYRFAPNYPPLLPGEKLVGSPNWAIDGTTVGTGSPFYYTFTATGSYEVVVNQATTTRTLYGRTSVTVNPNQLPTGSVDCSGSSIVKTTNPWSYTLSCKAVNAVDADGRITSMVWALPDLGVSKSGSTYWNYSLPTAQAVRVQLILTDDSGASTTLEKTVDLRTLR